MIVSLNWLKKYVKIDVPTEELVRLIGSRLVEVEEVIDETHRYDGILVVRVERAEKIPDTHLTLCEIDCGKPKPVQVLCGGPNVREGMLAAWIAPGATVPASYHEDAPFVIGTKKIRGYESNGMLAGADELGFGDVHELIVEIDPKMAKPGDKLAEVFDLNDILLDIENKSLTHRPDCFGIIGFAREIAGILGQKFTEPEWLMPRESKDAVLVKSAASGNEATSRSLGGEGEKLRKATSLPDNPDLKISIANPELCPRYQALIMHKKDQSEPKYLTQMQTLIARSGMRLIDPIVDMTNYLMLLTGQPLHAFDWDKFVEVGAKEAPEIIVRAAKKGEKMVLLDGREIECDENDILITSSNVPVALAGAMGAANTVIDGDTKRIIVESATFSLYNLRRTQMKHGIFSEAITRFTKGQPAGLTDPLVREFAKEMARELTPLQLFDEYPEKVKLSVVKITTDEINSVLGTEYDVSLIVKTLENVGFACKEPEQLASGALTRALPSSRGAGAAVRLEVGVEPTPLRQPPATNSSGSLIITPPYWRTDIHIKEDIIEEVGRLLGYDNIALTLPKRGASGVEVDPILTLKSEIRQILAGMGANEALTYSFVHGDLLRRGKQKPENSYKIINSISPTLEYIRQSLIPSLLEKATDNLKDGFDRFTLFEMNPVTNKKYGMNSEKVPVEKPKLGLVYVGVDEKTPYYSLKLMVGNLLSELGIESSFKPLKISAGSPSSVMAKERSAEVFDAQSGVSIGIIGELLPAVAADFKLPAAAVAQLHLDDLLKLRGAKKLQQRSEFPVVNRDVTLAVGAGVEYGDVFEKVCEVLRGAGLIFRVSPVSIYQGKDKKTKNVSLRLEFAHLEKTLSNKEIDAIMVQVEKLEEK